MPTVICNFCLYVGQGGCEQTQYHDAEKHELREHRAELLEMFDQEHIEHLEETYGVQ